MISAAALGPAGQRFIPKITGGLDHDSQNHIRNIISDVQHDIEEFKNDDLDEAMDAVMEARDMDLLVEEQNAALRQALETTKKTLSDYITRLEYLHQSYEDLRCEKERSDRELDVMRKATQDGANSAESVRLLEAQVHEQMEIIARGEETIRGYEKTKSHLEAEVQRLTHKSILCEELRDQVSEWKHKAEDLEKKANTAERYKQKLESQQNLVKELQNLQYERQELQDQLRSLMEENSRHAGTKKSEAELTKMIDQSEQDLWDERNHKNSLIRDLTACEEELVRLKAQRTHDESFIQDLQDQLQHGGGAVSNGEALSISSAALSLEDELKNASDDDDDSVQLNIPLELSRLKAENDLLRRTMGSTGDAALLRRELEGEKHQRELLQQKYNHTFEQLALAQSQVEALMSNMTGEGLVKTIPESRNLFRLTRLPLQNLGPRRFRTFESGPCSSRRTLKMMRNVLSNSRISTLIRLENY